jgi:hypothetical protein
MKKIIEFLKKLFTTTLLSVVGLTGGLLLGIGISKASMWQSSELKRKVSCQSAFDIMCVQVHACTGSKVSDCDEIVLEKEVCNIQLPDIQIIENCTEALRHIECSDDLPASCSLFME